MPEPPVFRRSPRIRAEVPSGEFEIPSPPQMPAAPSLSLSSVLVPALITALGVLVPFMVGGNRAWSYAAYTIPTMGLSCLWPLVQLIQQRRTFRAQVARRETKYRAVLRDCRGQLEYLRQIQVAALAEENPEPDVCLERATKRQPRLWERSPADTDFLALRLGLGAQPLSVTLKLPRRDPVAEADMLVLEADQLAGDFARVSAIPVLLPLGGATMTGLVGERTAVRETARALLLQLAAHHAPDEVRLAILFDEPELSAWAWARWLPHLWTDDRSRRLMGEGEAGARQVLADLHGHVQRSKGARFVLVVADLALLERVPAWEALRSEGSVHVLVLSASKERLPKECQQLVTLSGTTGQLLQTAAGSGAGAPFVPDSCSVEQAELFARALAPLRWQGAPGRTPLPARVAFLDLFQVDRVEELDVLRRWRESAQSRALAAPVGVQSGNVLTAVDLHETGHGPHGLVAGATGSGKSELLQSLILSLALGHHPHRLAFILVDYKGGGMAGGLQGLPHLIGTITNLQGGLAARALAALKGELRRRQSLLAAAGVNHVDDYQELGREPLPHLVFIVDEFAELKVEQPDFIRELVSAVRVGRSLGVHLILATQKPAGIVDEQIWGNARFRLCLRVERPEDSQEVLKRPEAAALLEAGRGYFQVGSGERFDCFQGAWAGAPYLPDIKAIEERALAVVHLDGAFQPLRPIPRPAGAVSQIEAVAAYIASEAERAGIKRLSGPWLPPLPETIPLEETGAAFAWNGRQWHGSDGWLQPCLGMFDDPAALSQGAFRPNLGREGHLAIYGAPGTGKTTLLQTAVTALALSHSPADLHLYLLDFGARNFSVFTALPHVGAVITGDETERVGRLFRHLLAELDMRKARLAEAGVGTFLAFRHAGGQGCPAIVVVLDNYAGLPGANPDWEDDLARMLREGGGLGIHFILSAHSPSTIRSKLSSSITLAIALTLADPSEYSVAVGRTQGLEPQSCPGRALVKGQPPLMVQIALPAPGEHEVERNRRLRLLFQQMSDAWEGARPRRIEALPDLLPYSAVPPYSVGLMVESLDPMVIDLREGPHFLVAGPPQSGKTSFLNTWLTALTQASTSGRLRLYRCDAGQDGESLRGLLEELFGQLDSSRGSEVHHLLVIDDLDLVLDSLQPDQRERLERMVRRERTAPFHLIASGSASDLASSWDGLVKAIRELQTGVLLGSTDHADLGLFNLRLPAVQVGKHLPPGEGYFVRRGRAIRFKAALLDP